MLTITDGYDGTLYMRSALKEIFITLAETVLLVGVVVVAMMGSFPEQVERLWLCVDQPEALTALITNQTLAKVS